MAAAEGEGKESRKALLPPRVNSAAQEERRAELALLPLRELLLLLLSNTSLAHVGKGCAGI